MNLRKLLKAVHNETEDLSHYMKLDEIEKNVMFDRIEKSVEKAKRKAGNEPEKEILKVYPSFGTGWTRVAACFAVLALGAGVFGLLSRVSDTIPTTFTQLSESAEGYESNSRFIKGTARVKREDVLKITEDMSLSDIQRILGKPETYANLKVGFYYIADDNEWVLIHFYDETTPLKYNGAKLLESDVKADRLVNDSKNNRFEGVTLNFTSFENNYYLIFCPQYEKFDIAEVDVKGVDKTSIVEQAEYRFEHAVITYDGKVEYYEYNFPSLNAQFFKLVTGE